MGQLSRAARRSHNILQPVFPARTARIRVPTEGGESRRLPRKPDARGADVSARVSLDQRRDDGDREMTTQANRAGVARLWLLNLVANAAALTAWYFWLLIPDAHGWQVQARRCSPPASSFWWSGCAQERWLTSGCHGFGRKECGLPSAEGSGMLSRSLCGLR